ncbi:hypothetical protein ACFVYG_22355 [Streptomyces sp. NPDC058256]|uniref:hypothetical protein n=1 Tax=Streptomyces sp. NPDC058256 TaxID=3346408 RepID=UPI0036E1DCE1
MAEVELADRAASEVVAGAGVGVVDDGVDRGCWYPEVGKVPGQALDRFLRVAGAVGVAVSGTGCFSQWSSSQWVAAMTLLGATVTPAANPAARPDAGRGTRLKPAPGVQAWVERR